MSKRNVFNKVKCLKNDIIQQSENFSSSIPNQEFEIQTTMQQSIENTRFRFDSSTMIYTYLL